MSVTESPAGPEEEEDEDNDSSSDKVSNFNILIDKIIKTINFLSKGTFI